MNLGDYIGDTRTESLPPGFLKSVKIKYRHEASNVFAGLRPIDGKIKECKSLTEEGLLSNVASGEDVGNDDEIRTHNAQVSICMNVARNSNFLRTLRLY